MSSFGEFCLRSLVRFRGAKSGTTPNTEDTFEDYFSWQYDGSALKFSLYPGFEPKGKTVLEIGCGTGGRTAYLASTGTARLVGSNQSGCSRGCKVCGTPAGAAADLQDGLALRFEAGIERELERTAVVLPGKVVLECVFCVWCGPALCASEPNKAAQAEFSK